MWWASDTKLIFGFLFASSDIRSCFVDTSSDSCVSVMFPSSDSIFRLPLLSAGFLRLGSPASSILSEAPTPVILLSALRCLRLDIPSVCTLFAFPSAGHWLTKTWRFRFYTWLPLTAIIRWRLTGSPRFLGNLLYTCPALRSRRNLSHLALAMVGCCLPLESTRRLSHW